MAKTSIALPDLAEKGADVDFVREMLHFAAQRLMEIDVEALCGAGYGDRATPRKTLAMATATGYGKRARVPSTYGSPSCERAVTFLGFSSPDAHQKRR